MQSSPDRSWRSTRGRLPSVLLFALLVSGLPATVAQAWQAPLGVPVDRYNRYQYADPSTAPRGYQQTPAQTSPAARKPTGAPVGTPLGTPLGTPTAGAPAPRTQPANRYGRNLPRPRAGTNNMPLGIPTLPKSASIPQPNNRADSTVESAASLPPAAQKNYNTAGPGSYTPGGGAGYAPKSNFAPSAAQIVPADSAPTYAAEAPTAPDPTAFTQPSAATRPIPASPQQPAGVVSPSASSELFASPAATAAAALRNATPSAAPSTAAPSIAIVQPATEAPQIAEAQPTAEAQPSASPAPPVAPTVKSGLKQPALAQPGIVQPAGAKTAATAAKSNDIATAAAKADASDETANGIKVEAATFRGVRPGVTTLAELRKGWGDPKASLQPGEDGTVLLYAFDPFPRIEVKVQEDVVSSLVVQLAGAFTPEKLAERLGLHDLRPVEVCDEQGAILGRAFPERGVLFSYQPGVEPTQVAQVLIEPIDLQAFVLRAESNLYRADDANLADLEYVAKADPTFAHAHYLQGKIRLHLDQIEEAQAALDEALRLMPSEPAYQLLRVECEARRGKHELAIKGAGMVLTAEELALTVKARALVRQGQWLTEGSTRDYKQAVARFSEAIKIAEPLAIDPDVSIRRAAKEALLDANLGMACAIAWGNWNRKNEVVPKWVERAETIAREIIEHDGGGADLRLHVIERALAAHAGFTPGAEPAPFLTAADQLAESLAAGGDPLTVQQAHWRLGQIYHHALRVEHVRGNAEAAATYAQLAQEHLETGAPGRQASELARFELGRLYFNIGALYAVHKQDHETAVEWYAKADPLLTPRPNMLASEPGQIGEMLVSMGVSCWEVKMKQKALELTTAGVELVKQGVERGTLAESSLAVPYGNLASMHQALGDATKARDYSAKAETIGSTLRK